MKPFSRSLRLLSSILSILAFGASSSAQTTWFVDDDAPSDPSKGNPLVGDPMADGSSAHPFDRLDQAITAASSGDTILVRPSNPEHSGLPYYWTSTIDLSGAGGPKALTLRSTDGPANTVIQGISASLPDDIPLFRAIQGETSATLIEGFTFRGADNGSGTGDLGGAFVVSGSSPTFRNCRFEDGQAYLGGGAYLIDSNSLFEDCTFTGNDVVHQGGAVYSANGAPTFSRCRFEGNTANYGGAYLIRTTGGGSPKVLDCDFLGNEALVGYGGALAKFDGGTVTVERSRFVSNVAITNGGGIHVSGNGTVRDCLIQSNVAGSGGGLTAQSSTLCLVTGTTFTNNSGGAALEVSSTMLRLRNCILWGDAPFELGAGVDVAYCAVMGGYAGAGNIDVDPLFENSFGLDGMLGTLDDDLSLMPESPCIDAGNSNDVLSAGPYPLDITRRARAVDRSDVPDTGVAVLGLTVDLGAFEFQPQRDFPLPIRSKTVGN